MKRLLFLGTIWFATLTMYGVLGAAEMDIRPGRTSVRRIGWEASGKGGAVAAGGSGAVAAGISILEQGGNAADAAAATLLALSITDYGSFTIGAEIPLIIYDARKEEVKVLCGLGGAPLNKNAINWYYKNDIPSNGNMKAAPVPGALSLCITTVKLYGTMSFEQVVAPSLELLDSGGKD